jgi:hypothetical protein
MEVFRDQIKESRSQYYVTYHPADCRSEFAYLYLTFTDFKTPLGEVEKAMESELDIWIQRYPVPVMITSFDLSEDIFPVRSDTLKSHLFGYLDSASNQIVKQWGGIENRFFPKEQLGERYLETVYQDVPFRKADEVRARGKAESRNLALGSWMILFLLFVVPVIIEAISLGVSWLGYVVSGISIGCGMYKAGKAFGWIKRSKRELEVAEKNRKKDHYFWHCERNPEAFQRLKQENDRRQIIESNLREKSQINDKSK